MLQASGLEKEMFVNFTYEAKRDASGKVDGILAIIYEVTDQVNEQKEMNSSRLIFVPPSLLEILLWDCLSRTQYSPHLPKASDPNEPTTFHATRGRGIYRRKIEKLLNNTLHQTDRLGRLVNDMLDVSRINSGKLTIKLEETNLSELVKDTVERFLPQFEAAGCQFHSFIDPEIRLPLDAARIEQVVVNFMTNAIKYAPAKKCKLKWRKPLPLQN